MAHFIIYKRPTEVTPYEFDFEDLLPDDASLDTDQSQVSVVDSAGIDQTKYFVSHVVFSGIKMTAFLVNGLDGEDYIVYADGVGNVTAPVKLNRILEVRVRSQLAGNL